MLTPQQITYKIIKNSMEENPQLFKKQEDKLNILLKQMLRQHNSIEEKQNVLLKTLGLINALTYNYYCNTFYTINSSKNDKYTLEDFFVEINLKISYESIYI